MYPQTPSDDPFLSEALRLLRSLRGAELPVVYYACQHALALLLRLALVINLLDRLLQQGRKKVQF